MSGLRLAAWLDPGQEDLCRAVASAAGCELVSVGCSDRGRADVPASHLGVPVASDLRSLLMSEPVAAVLILGATDLGTDSTAQDVGALDAAVGRGVHVVAAEPIPAAALELNTGGWDQFESSPSGLITVPSVLPVLREHFADLFTEFGTPRAGHIEILTSPLAGGLASAVWSAAELLHEFFGEPEMVDASYTDPVGKPGLKLLPGESLRGLRGTLTVNIRATSGRSVSMLLSDQAPMQRAEMKLLGPSGMITCGSEQDGEWARWIPPDLKAEVKAGVNAASVHSRRPPSSADAPSTRWLVHALRRGLAARTGPCAGPCRVETLLTITQAMLLSARTSQAESPETIARMVQSVRGG
jgi:hypothetical protein